MLPKLLSITCLIFALAACGPEQVLSQTERKLQSRADAEVATVLFDADVSEHASYRVHKNSRVVIRFADSVDAATYTRVVQVLRSSEHIGAVRAEQGGREVCPLR